MLLYKYYWNGIDHIYLFYIVCKTFIVKLVILTLEDSSFCYEAQQKKIKNKKVFVMRFLFMTCWLFYVKMLMLETTLFEGSSLSLVPFFLGYVL